MLKEYFSDMNDIIDMFLVINGSEIRNYADNATMYSCDSKAECVLDSLEQGATRISPWYPESYRKLIVDKFHHMIYNEKSYKVKMHI